MFRGLKFLIIFTLFFTVFFVDTKDSFAGGFTIVRPQTDNASYILVSIFDLRNRESYVQVTNTSDSALTTHVQVFAVNDNCRENDFFDTYTGNDTHVYNMRDILTNDGNPSGVVLNGGEYGMVVVTATLNGLINDVLQDLVGNFRIVDEAGYEYRTNSSGTNRVFIGNDNPFGTTTLSTGNFNSEGGTNQSDTYTVVLSETQNGSVEVTANPLETFIVSDVDIYDLNEVPFSCPNTIFACVDQNSAVLEELLEEAAEISPGASIATFDSGLNEVYPSSKGAPLVCPNNVVK